MNTRENFKKIANLLFNGGISPKGCVFFDWSSYDLDNDIPRLNIDGNIVKIEEFRINKRGTQITIIKGKDCYTLDLTTSPFSEQDYVDMGMYDLIDSIYAEIGYVVE